MTTAANGTAIANLQDEMKGIKKNVANVDKLQTRVDNLGQQLSTLIKWQQSVANHAIVKLKETAALADSLSKRVQAPKSSHLSQSAFEEWVDAEFARIQHLCDFGPTENTRKESSHSQQSRSPLATPSTPARNAKNDKLTGEEP